MKPKQYHKTKEQIIWEKEEGRLAKKRMEFINQKFMPLMEELTENVEEAQFITESLKVAISQAFANLQTTMTVSDLKMIESLKNVKRPEAVEKHRKVLEILNDQTIQDAVKLCDGLYDASNEAIISDIKKKKLSDFRKNG